MARQLLDLGMLYMELQERDGFPWLVSTSAQAELGVHVGRRAAGNLDLLRYFAGHQGDWDVGAFPGVALGALWAGGTGWRPSPLIHRALGVDDVTAIIASDGPLSFLPDTGDRCIARDALLANVPGILTLDLRTFWRYREELAHLGVEVLRPSDLLDAYEQVWDPD